MLQPQSTHVSLRHRRLISVSADHSSDQVDGSDADADVFLQLEL